jgi:hypothetical protein
MEIKLAHMPKTKVKTIKSTTWNLKRPGGREYYKDLSDKAAGKIEKIVTDENLSIDEKMKTVVSIEREIKFAAFGKTRISTNKKPNKSEALT